MSKKKPSPAAILRKARAAMNRDKHHAAIMRAVKAAGLPEPEREHEFFPGRKWRLDYYFRGGFAIEVQGGGARGRHSNLLGQAKDYEKFNAATKLGIQILFYNAISIKDESQIAADLRALWKFNG